MTSLPDTLNRDILRLAVPALGALVAEPLFLIVDSALVGHLGITPLAGLGIASAVLQTIVGLMVFLAYSTTPAVARRFGAGDPSRAVSVGIDGMWLALGIGGVLALIGYVATPFLVGLFGAMELLTDPYTLADKGQVKVNSFQMADGVVQHPSAFVQLTGALIA